MTGDLADGGDAAAPLRDRSARLRVLPPQLPFHLTLVDPEIPQNTGSVARLAAATSCPLHLVGTLGFRIDEKSVRRAGVDYWHLVDVRRHLDLAHFGQKIPVDRWLLFSAHAEASYLDAPFRQGDALVFGRESTGLDEELLAAHPTRVFGIPTSGAVRSLNLSNAVSIVLYEALRQTGALAGARPVGSVKLRLGGARASSRRKLVATDAAWCSPRHE